MRSAPLQGVIPFSERLYSLLLLLYPSAFRTIYRREMLQTYRECYREALQQRGGRGLVPLWSFLLCDLVTAAFIEHVRSLATRLRRLFAVSEKENAPLVAPFYLKVAQLTDIGRKRESNEDSLASVVPQDPRVMSRKGALFVVSDGLGGRAAGEVASELAVRTVSEVYYQDENDDAALSLQNAVKQANDRICQMNEEKYRQSAKKFTMGTTCVAAVLQDDIVYVANVGDSRAYIIRDGELKQISEDHSLVAEMVSAGLLTKEQARTHEKRNLISRCLGEPGVEVDTFSEPVREGDMLVLCSDGLSQVIGDEALLTIVEQYGPEQSVHRLVECANEQGGPDNITAIVVRVSREERAS